MSSELLLTPGGKIERLTFNEFHMRTQPSSLDFTPSPRHLRLSPRFSLVRNEAFFCATNLVLQGGSGGFKKGRVREQMTMLIQEGTTFLTDEQTEIGRWDRRTEGINYSSSVAPGSYFAFVDPNYGWDYDPFLVIYTKNEFIEIFEDCCRLFVKYKPERRDEFSEAMIANGMTLD